MCEQVIKNKLLNLFVNVTIYPCTCFKAILSLASLAVEQLHLCLGVVLPMFHLEQGFRKFVGLLKS